MGEEKTDTPTFVTSTPVEATHYPTLIEYWKEFFSDIVTALQETHPEPSANGTLSPTEMRGPLPEDASQIQSVTWGKMTDGAKGLEIIYTDESDRQVRTTLLFDRAAASAGTPFFLRQRVVDRAVQRRSKNYSLPQTLLTDGRLSILLDFVERPGDTDPAVMLNARTVE